MSSHTIKRITNDLKELRKYPIPGASAEPLEDDMLKWHFTFIGPCGSNYENIPFHGVIEFPQNYPDSPPKVFFLHYIANTGVAASGTDGRWTFCMNIMANYENYHGEWKKTVGEGWGPGNTVSNLLVQLQSALYDSHIFSMHQQHINTTKKGATELVCAKCKHEGSTPEKYLPVIKVAAHTFKKPESVVPVPVLIPVEPVKVVEIKPVAEKKVVPLSKRQVIFQQKLKYYQQLHFEQELNTFYMVNHFIKPGRIEAHDVVSLDQQDYYDCVCDEEEEAKRVKAEQELADKLKAEQDAIQAAKDKADREAKEKEAKEKAEREAKELADKKKAEYDLQATKEQLACYVTREVYSTDNKDFKIGIPVTLIPYKAFAEFLSYEAIKAGINRTSDKTEFHVWIPLYVNQTHWESVNDQFMENISKITYDKILCEYDVKPEFCFAVYKRLRNLIYNIVNDNMKLRQHTIPENQLNLLLQLTRIIHVYRDQLLPYITQKMEDLMISVKKNIVQKIDTLLEYCGMFLVLNPFNNKNPNYYRKYCMAFIREIIFYNKDDYLKVHPNTKILNLPIFFIYLKNVLQHGAYFMKLCQFLNKINWKTDFDDNNGFLSLNLRTEYYKNSATTIKLDSWEQYFNFLNIPMTPEKQSSFIYNSVNLLTVPKKVHHNNLRKEANFKRLNQLRIDSIQARIDQDITDQINESIKNSPTYSPQQIFINT